MSAKSHGQFGGPVGELGNVERNELLIILVERADKWRQASRDLTKSPRPSFSAVNCACDKLFNVSLELPALAGRYPAADSMVAERPFGCRSVGPSWRRIH